MIDPFQTILLVASLVLAAVALGYVVFDRTPDILLVGGCALLELGLVAQATIGIVQVVRGVPGLDAVTFVGYLLGALLVLPAGVAWSLAERGRPATAVLVLAALTVGFLVLRLEQIHRA